jgi:tight adherence protein C
MLLTWLSALFAALAAVCAMLAADRAVRSSRQRHREEWEDFRRRRAAGDPWSAAEGLLVGIATAELGGMRLRSLRDRVAVDLARAAEPSTVSAEGFVGRALMEGVGISMVIVLLSLIFFGRPLILLALGAGAFYAVLVRPHLLHERAEERIGRIARELPYAIDLLVLVLGAGSTLREALAMLAQSGQGEPLAEELATVLEQIEAGSSQARALEDLAARLALDDMTSLVLAINLGDETGAPLTKTLVAQAELLRARRIQRAERMAVEAPVKMMVPNTLILISVLLIVLGPVILKLVSGGVL